MPHVFFADAVTDLYMIANVGRLFAYMPQIRRLARADRSEGVSVGSWIVFAIAHASTAAYAIEVQDNPMIAWWAVGNLTTSVAIAGLAWYRRHQREARASSLDQPFYCAAFLGQHTISAMASGEDRVGLGRRVDATLFDAMARHKRHAMTLQFRPFGLATRIGIRAAWMKSAA
jgi:uncharacterized protein with PQ loop repeat